MAITISNKNFRLLIETAGEKYTGSRFDWNGTITQVYYNSIPLLGQEKKLFKRNKRIYGRGLHNEFGIRDCIGYDDIPVGGWFPKIGTGWLKKDDAPYFFYTQYEMEPLHFSLYRPEASKAVFTCTSGERNGYSYTYTKTISLKDDGFEIDYCIENTGTKDLSTTEYVHNFFCPALRAVDSHLALKFGWNFEQASLGQLSTAGSLAITDNAISFEKKPDGEFFMGGIWNARTADTVPSLGQWTLTDTKENLVISEKDSFVPDGSDMWGHSKAISPELFFRFSVEPGSSVNWQRRYTVSSAVVSGDSSEPIA